MVVLKRGGKTGSRRGCLCCKGSKSGPFSLHQGLGYGEEEEEEEVPHKEEKPAPLPAPPSRTERNEADKPPGGDIRSSRPSWTSTAVVVLIAAAAAYRLHRVLKGKAA